MELRDFCELTLEKAKKAGITPAETYASVQDSYNLTIRNAVVDDASIKQQQGVGLRGLVNGKIGAAYTEALTADAADTLVRGVLQTASVVDDTDEQPFCSTAEAAAFDPYDPAFEGFTAEVMIAMAKEAEAAALAADKRVTRCQATGIRRAATQILIMNSFGLSRSCRDGKVLLFSDAIAEADGRMFSGYDADFARDPAKLNAKAIGEKAARETVATIGAKPIASGKVDVVLRDDVMADMLATFAEAFSAEEVQRGLSCLGSKLNTAIGAPIVTLREEPHEKEAYAARAFDGEGVATLAYDLVRGGVLQTYMHNLKTAKKDGVASTGNAVRGYKQPVSVYPTNLTLLPGAASEAEMLKALGNGLLITSLNGAGSSTTTGEFSLILRGFQVQNGEIARPIENMTLAGTLSQLLSSIRMIGAKLYRGTGTSAPAVLVEGLTAAGE